MKKICYIATLPETIHAFFVPQLKYLAEKGFDVSVVCSPDNNLQQELGARIVYHPIDIPRGISLSGSVRATKKLLELFKNEKYDLIQYSTPNAALYSAIAGKIAGIKVRNYHLMGFRYLGASGLMRPALKLMEKTTCQLSTSIECVSNSNLQIGIEERIFDKDKATVVWNGSTGGVDLHRFDINKRESYRKEIRNQYGISPDTFVYGFVGRITRDKGANEILEAFYQIENAKLMMIGSLEGKQTLDEKLYQNSINDPNILYTGNVTEVQRYFAALDVLLLPSYREGFGNVVIEAAAMGTPAIVSDIPGPVDTMDPGRTALVIPVKNADSLQKAMKRIQMLDYVGMGECATKFVRDNFDSNILYEKILERKKLLLSQSKCQHEMGGVSMKQRLVNILKYNKTVYAVYHGVFTLLVNFLRFFVSTDDHLILFNSFSGRKYDDSPKEIYLAMREDPRFKDYKLVWALHEPEKFVIPDAQIIKTDNLHYFITAIKARVWVTNSSVERGLSFRGKHTLYFNTWHGSPIKKMGSDINSGNEAFCKKNCEFDVMCSQGDFETDIFSRCFNLPKEKFLNCGYPRNDILVNYTEQQRQEIRDKLGIGQEQRAILYCPTFREYEKDENLGVVLAPPMDLKKWEQRLGEQYVLLFRAHYEVSTVMRINENSFTRNMTAYPSLNELMIAADILVSDYSSIFFDYAITGKPMLHFCYDYKKYDTHRGMYFDIRDWLEGADNEDDLLNIIISNKEVLSHKTERFRNQYVNYFGNATKQCVECIVDQLQ